MRRVLASTKSLILVDLGTCILRFDCEYESVGYCSEVEGFSSQPFFPVQVYAAKRIMKSYCDIQPLTNSNVHITKGMFRRIETFTLVSCHYLKGRLIQLLF